MKISKVRRFNLRGSCLFQCLGAERIIVSIYRLTSMLMFRSRNFTHWFYQSKVFSASVRIMWLISFLLVVIKAGSVCHKLQFKNPRRWKNTVRNVNNKTGLSILSQQVDTGVFSGTNQGSVLFQSGQIEPKYCSWACWLSGKALPH